MNINIEFTEQRAVYPNPYYSPLICKIDKELPKILNGGYNNYSFSEQIDFNIVVMEPCSYEGKELRRVKNWVYSYEFIEVHSPSGKITGLQYYKTADIETGKTCTFFIAP